MVLIALFLREKPLIASNISRVTYLVKNLIRLLNLAEKWQMSKFNPSEYNRLRRERAMEKQAKYGQRRAMSACGDETDAQLDLLELGASDSDDEESSSEDDEVSYPLIVAMTHQNHNNQHIYVHLEWEGQHYRALVDTGSTLTILSGVRFVAARFPDFRPTAPHEVAVQGVSGNLLTFMGKCDVLMAAGPTVARVEVWFTRELPIDALLRL